MTGSLSLQTDFLFNISSHACIRRAQELTFYATIGRKDSLSLNIPGVVVVVDVGVTVVLDVDVVDSAFTGKHACVIDNEFYQDSSILAYNGT